MTTFRLSPATTTVKDTTPPVFTSLTATPSVIFPPKGQNVTVTVSGEATDDSGVDAGVQADQRHGTWRSRGRLRGHRRQHGFGARDWRPDLFT